MHPVGYTSYNSFRRLLAAVALVAATSSPAWAVLVHKYTFNNNTANDSVGTAHGVIVDNTGISTYTGGALNLTANNGAGSNQNFALPTTVGAYVDLPNGIFTGAVNGGSFGQVTLEMWLTVQEHRNWAEAFVFGTSNNGEDTSVSGSSSQYVALIPRSGPQDFRATTKATAVETPIIGTATPLPVNVRHHVVLTLDELDATGGPNGTAKLYLNNGAPVTAAIAPIIDAINDNNNWLGRAQWPDPLFDGFIDEFRIYNHALDAAAVAASFTAGPEPSPLPVLVVNRDTGAISLANQTAGNIQLKGYTISSAAGALNPATWTSVDADNTFDNNGTWTASSSTNLQLAESVTGGTLDGGSLGAGASRGVGTPWVKTPVEDVTFGFTLGDNSTGTGLVQYTGTAAIRSDLNGDGAITPADWAVFVPNSSTAFAADPAAVAYRKGDLDGDRDNDFSDFRLFKADFIAANGEPAFATLVGAVPEPAGVTMLLAALLALAAARRR
jgi:hypothetical protein